jgi:cytochrome c oxidase subunit 4
MSEPHESHAFEEARATHGSELPQPHTSHVNYLFVFYALCVFTGVSWLADEIPRWMGIEGKAKVAVGLVVLAVACCKASLVIMYFMHIKFEGRWKYALLAPTVILALALMIALAPDIGSEYYMRLTPQTLEHPTTSAADSAQPAHH